MTVLQLTQVGWHWSPADEGDAGGGSGWLEVASAPPGTIVDQAAPTRLWWNFPQAALAGSVGLVTAILVIWLTMLLVAACVEFAHRSSYRGEYRMTAAMHYGTAWVLLILIGALVLGFLPLSYCGAMAGWKWFPSEMSVTIAGGAVGGLGVCLGWFWLVRISATAPVRTRTRVASFFAVGLPVIVAAAACGWHLGLMKLYEILTPMFDLDFV